MRKEIIKKILKYYIITRIILIIVMLVSNFLLIKKFPNIKSIFYLWDGEHYINIANNGYVKDYLYAFFPLVPLLLRYFKGIGLLLLNQIFVFMTSYLLYLIGYKELKIKEPLEPVKLFLISPISITTMIFYTEPLFIFLTTLSYYLYKEKRNYLILGITLGLCSTVRNTGSILFFSIFFSMVIDFFKKNISIKNIIITYIPATLISIIYPVYLYFKTGNILKFIEVQKYWLKKGTNILRIIYDVIIATINDFRPLFAINSILTILLMIYLIRNIIINRKEKKYRSLFIYMILTIIMISFTIKGNGDPLTSYYRYLFACFPIYFMIKPNIKNYTLLCIASIIITDFFLMNIYFF